MRSLLGGPHVGNRLNTVSDEREYEFFRPSPSPKIGDRYDWTTGAPDNGNEWRKFRVVPHSYPLRPLSCTLFNMGVETQGLLDYQGRAGIISVIRWNLRPVIFGVDKSPKVAKKLSRLRFQSRLKTSISLEMLNLDLRNSPQQIGLRRWLA